VLAPEPPPPRLFAYSCAGLPFGVADLPNLRCWSLSLLGQRTLFAHSSASYYPFLYGQPQAPVLTCLRVLPFGVFFADRPVLVVPQTGPSSLLFLSVRVYILLRPWVPPYILLTYASYFSLLPVPTDNPRKWVAGLSTKSFTIFISSVHLLPVPHIGPRLLFASSLVSRGYFTTLFRAMNIRETFSMTPGLICKTRLFTFRGISVFTFFFQDTPHFFLRLIFFSCAFLSLAHPLRNRVC